MTYLTDAKGEHRCTIYSLPVVSFDSGFLHICSLLGHDVLSPYHSLPSHLFPFSGIPKPQGGFPLTKVRTYLSPHLFQIA